MVQRIVLHCDMNGFYASVECLYRPELHNKPVAVCGDVEKRHGIILAKNEFAKQFGIRSGETVWQARKKCPHLVCLPPRFDRYRRISAMANAIYNRYTDRVEPFGIDESWLELTGCVPDFAAGVQTAQQIRKTIQQELGVTVSVGVSFNKVFAKLGSDLKKPDAVSVIDRVHFRQILYDHPCEELLYVGPATRRRLNSIGVTTLGELARCNPAVLKSLLGKWGLALHAFANGHDDSKVSVYGTSPLCKGIGNSTTMAYDLTQREPIKQVLYMLCESVSERMRRQHIRGSTLSLWLRQADLLGYTRQISLPQPIQSSRQMAFAALSVLDAHWRGEPLRSLGIRMTDLCYADAPQQMCLWPSEDEKDVQLDMCVDALRARFGHACIHRALCLTRPALYINPIDENTVHPVPFFRDALRVQNP